MDRDACAVYFWARVAHLIVYTLGLPVFRTLAFTSASSAGGAGAGDLQDSLSSARRQSRSRKIAIGVAIEGRETGQRLRVRRPDRFQAA